MVVLGVRVVDLRTLRLEQMYICMSIVALRACCFNQTPFWKGSLSKCIELSLSCDPLVVRVRPVPSTVWPTRIGSPEA